MFFCGEPYFSLLMSHCDLISLDFRRCLGSGPQVSFPRGNSPGSFPQQQLVIEATHHEELEKRLEN